MRRLSRDAHIALRGECIHYAQCVLGMDGSQAQYLDWIEFFERIHLDGPGAMRGVYGAPKEGVVALRVIGPAT